MEKSSYLPLISEFRRFFFLPLEKVWITPEMVQYGKKALNCHQITEIRYGASLLMEGNKNLKNIYVIGIKDRANKKIMISLVSSFLTSNKTKDERESLYQKLISALWEAVGNQIFKNLLTQLTSGKNVRIGPCEVTTKGLNLTYRRWFIKRTDFIPWGQCLKESSNGSLQIWSKDNEKIKVSLKYLKVWNAVVLHSLLDFLWEDGRAYQLQQL